MRLSEIIIYQDLPALEQALSQDQSDLNRLDAYGYTPLIESLIANDTGKASLLIEQGADVNLQDVTHRTPLHWACENNNETVSRLLLEKGANPNAHHFSGEAVLVKPLLRQNKKFIQLLWEYGANTNFAHDYINAKTIGHLFELKGSVDIATPDGQFTEIDYEGFYFESSLELMAYAVRDYIQNYAARDVRPWLPVMQMILRALENAMRLIKYDHYLIEAQHFRTEIASYMHTDPLVIPMSQEGHAVTLIRHKNLFAICDRAAIEAGQGIKIYYMNKPYQLDDQRIFDWIYQKQQLTVLYRTLPALLGLQPVAEVPLQKQVIGNCSWANAEAIVPILYYMIQTNDPNNLLSPEHVMVDAMDIYYRWQGWSKERALSQCLHAFEEASPARKASKAAILAGILFQTCSAENEAHIALAKRILPILKTKGYEYILKSYITFYLHRKKTKAGENLQCLIDIFEREVV